MNNNDKEQPQSEMNTPSTKQTEQTSNHQSWKMFALYGMSSLNLGFIVMGGYFLGLVCEEQYGMKNMSLTGVLTGLFLGLYQMFSLAINGDRKRNGKK